MSGPDRELLLDANASVPPSPAALEALARAAALGANPSSPHAAGRRARRALDDARAAVAAALGGQPREVLFLSGASEANRWLVDGLVATGGRRGRPLRVLASVLEHPSLLGPLEAGHAAGNLSLTLAPLDEQARPALLEHLDQHDAVVITAAHNETGALPDLDELAAHLPDETLLLTDASQAVGRRSTPPLARADAVVCSGHKLGGVAGAGALLLRGRGRELHAGWPGGGQEAGRRPGTEALAAIAALGAACAEIDETRAAHQALAPARDRLEAGLVDTLGDITPLAAGGPRLSNTTCAVIEGVDGDALRMALDGAGLLVGFGAACSALAPEPSRALLGMGLSPARARASVRLSLAPGGERLVDEALERLSAAIGSLRRRVARKR